MGKRPEWFQVAILRVTDLRPVDFVTGKRVAEHFRDTDAPLGEAARAAIAKARGEVR